MGDFRMQIDAVGGHGCQREVKDGGELYGCGRQGCPDCEFTTLIAEYARRTSCQITGAKLTHWPGQSSEIVDEVKLPKDYPITAAPRLWRIRHGSFS